jgi:hypothetical protein
LNNFPVYNFPNVTDIFEAWKGCSGLLAFPQINFPKATRATSAWNSCSSLATFPLITLPEVTDVSMAWLGCSSLTEFPPIQFTKAITLNQAWKECTSMRKFGVITAPIATMFRQSWYKSGITVFPDLDLRAGKDFTQALSGSIHLTTFGKVQFRDSTNFSNFISRCSSLTTFPPNIFDTCTAVTTYQDVAATTPLLDAVGETNILESIVTSGAAGGGARIDISNNAPLTPAGAAAKVTLVSKGWTVNAV